MPRFRNGPRPGGLGVSRCLARVFINPGNTKLPLILLQEQDKGVLCQYQLTQNTRGFYPQTKADIIRAWKESLRHLDDQEDTIVAGYITTDVGVSDYWNREVYPTYDEKGGYEEFIYIYELAHDLEVPGGPKKEREEDWQRLQEGVQNLEKKYLTEK